MPERERSIYERSIALADSEGVPDWIEDGGDGWWLPIPNRASAIDFYAREHGLGFTEVRCIREYMRIDRDAIADAAADIAEGDPDDYGDEPIAYTWEGEGWLWQRCEKGASGAVALWRCEKRAAALSREQKPR